MAVYNSTVDEHGETIAKALNKVAGKLGESGDNVSAALAGLATQYETANRLKLLELILTHGSDEVLEALAIAEVSGNKLSVKSTKSQPSKIGKVKQG